jgi:hypothetical protein
MQTRRWFNPTQPQMLQIAVFLLYFRAVFLLLGGLEDNFVVFPLSDVNRSGVSNPVLLVAFMAAMVVGAYLIANERKLGWQLGLAAAVLPLLARALLMFGISFSGIDVPSIGPLEYDVLGLVFDVALVALLVHPQTREYQKIWFK